MDYIITSKRNDPAQLYRESLARYLKALGFQDELSPENPLLDPPSFFQLHQNELYCRPWYYTTQPFQNVPLTPECFPDFLHHCCGLPDHPCPDDQRKSLYRALQKYVLSERKNISLIDKAELLSIQRTAQVCWNNYSSHLDNLLKKAGLSVQSLHPLSPLMDPESHFYHVDEKLFTTDPFPESDICFDNKEFMLTQLNTGRFPRYLRIVCSLMVPDDCTKECRALYTSLKDLICRKKSLKDRALENMLPLCPALSTALRKQDEAPFLYRSEDGQFLLDASVFHSSSVRFHALRKADLAALQIPGSADVPQSLLKKYFSHLGDSSLNMQSKTYHHCVISPIVMDEQQSPSFHQRCALTDNVNLPTLKPAHFPENAILYNGSASPNTVMPLTYDPKQDSWSLSETANLYITVPCHKPISYASDALLQRGVPTYYGIYNQKLMPENFPEVLPLVTKNCETLFRLLIGDSDVLLQKVLCLLAKIMLSGLSGLTVIYSPCHTKLLKEVMAQIFYGCFVPEKEFSRSNQLPANVITASYSDAQYSDIRLSSAVKPEAIRQAYAAQMEGRSLRFLRDTIPTGSGSAQEHIQKQFRCILKGGLIKLTSPFLPEYSYRSHLYYLCITDQDKAVTYFRDKFDADVIDLSYAESPDAPEAFRLKSKDLHCLRTTILAQGLKLYTLAQVRAKEPEPQPERFSLPPEVITAEQNSTQEPVEAIQDKLEDAELEGATETTEVIQDEQKDAELEAPTETTEAIQDEQKDAELEAPTETTEAIQDDQKDTELEGPTETTEVIQDELKDAEPEDAAETTEVIQDELEDAEPEGAVETPETNQDEPEDSVQEDVQELDTPPVPSHLTTNIIRFSDYFPTFFTSPAPQSPQQSGTAPAEETSPVPPVQKSAPKATAKEPPASREEMLHQFLTDCFSVSAEGFVSRDQVIKSFKKYMRKTYPGKKQLVLKDTALISELKSLIPALYPGKSVKWKRKHINATTNLYGFAGLAPKDSAPKDK